MVKMLLTNCYIQLWIYLCCVFLVSTESLIETNKEKPPHIADSQVTATALDPAVLLADNLPQIVIKKPYGTIIKHGSDVSQKMMTKSYDANFITEIFEGKTPKIEDQGFISNPLGYPNIKPVTPTLNINPQVLSHSSSFNKIFFALSRQSTFEAFSFLLRSLDSYNIPPNLINVQSTLLRLIRLNFLRVREILDYLQRYSHLQETDLAIMGLLLLAQSLPQNCELRGDIHELASTIVLIKLIEQAPTVMPIDLNCVNNFPQLENPPKCICKPELENNYIFRPTTEQTITTNTLLELQKQEEKRLTIIKETLIGALTIPRVPEMEHAYNVTKSFIENSQNLEILKLLATNGSSTQLLLQFYTIVKQITTISIQVKEEILRYTDYVLGRYTPTTTTPENRFDYTILLELLPNPADSIEEKYLALLTKAFKSEEGYILFKQLGVEGSSDHRKNLIEVLKVLNLHYSSVETKEAAKYYLEYLEKLDSLTLIGTKKIEKRFDLNGIFSDTLQLGTLPSSAKLAFKQIYKYIANLRGKEMENFNEWNEASTRAQFTHYLFNYFLSQDFVPDDIKTAIKTLIPHIKKDGKGALPP